MRNDLSIYSGISFDDFFERLVKAGDHFSKSTAPYELEETENGFVMAVEIPGVKKEDVKVEVLDQTLLISADRKRGGGSFSYRLSIPRFADSSKLEANLEDGVLEVAIPKIAAAQARTVEIGAGTGLFAKLLSSLDKTCA